MKKFIIGILAHVDAGKTTLSESLLYISGKIQKLGRVDKKDAYLDNFELERARGITIFSKQATLEVDDTEITLLDTPGHVDFSAEMERTIQVMDYAILVINGAEGVQGHTKTLWHLLGIYKIPVFIFVNKMDQQRIEKEDLLIEVKKQLDDGCVDFSNDKTEEFFEQLALCDEKLLNTYLKTGSVKKEQIQNAILQCKVFPCFFGSALKLEGIEQFIKGILEYSKTPSYPNDFGARIYKIGRDDQGNRLTYMKITGGSLKTRDLLSNGIWEEKVNQIRIYSGQKFTAVNEARAGSICAVTGLSQTKAGEVLGIESSEYEPILTPVLTYQIILPDNCDPRTFTPKLREIEEEIPELQIVWDEKLKEIQVQIMGAVQIEILQSLIKSRFDIDVEFDQGRIAYKETITNTVEGVGHFEPLRHYAEVHLLLEPKKRGSGLEFAVDCSDDILAKNWKNLVISHLKEKVHKGVLTGSPITDMKITLVSGRASNKHTDGGDFREATWRAVRQGLKEAESILLEPYYSFYLELPEKMLGRAMTDIENLHGTCQITSIKGETAILEGSAPVVNMRNYHQEVIAYTKGEGKLFCALKGYEECHNPDEVIEMMGYDSERDIYNPTGSVFCANGSGFLVPWDEVKNYMHVESYLQTKRDVTEQIPKSQTPILQEKWLEPDEVDKILARTYYANAANKTNRPRRKIADNKQTTYIGQKNKVKDEYLLVDGYNVIYAWPELTELAKENMDFARTKLLDYLSKYQSIRSCHIIAVFDAYQVEGRHREEIIDYQNIHVVYTKEAQTADEYIEKFSFDNQKKYDITVATSDGVQQIIIRGTGSDILSARELIIEIENTLEQLSKEYKEKQSIKRNFLEDVLSEETKKQMDAIRKETQ